jgi:hypothetical protein
MPEPERRASGPGQSHGATECAPPSLSLTVTVRPRLGLCMIVGLRPWAPSESDFSRRSCVTNVSPYFERFSQAGQNQVPLKVGKNVRAPVAVSSCCSLATAHRAQSEPAVGIQQRARRALLRSRRRRGMVRVGRPFIVTTSSHGVHNGTSCLSSMRYSRDPRHGSNRHDNGFHSPSPAGQPRSPLLPISFTLHRSWKMAALLF